MTLADTLDLTQIVFYTVGTVVVVVGATLALRRYVVEDPHSTHWEPHTGEFRVGRLPSGQYFYTARIEVQNASSASQYLVEIVRSLQPPGKFIGHRTPDISDIKQLHGLTGFVACSLECWVPPGGRAWANNTAIMDDLFELLDLRYYVVSTPRRRWVPGLATKPLIEANERTLFVDHRDWERLHGRDGSNGPATLA